MKDIYSAKSPSCVYAGKGCLNRLPELLAQREIKSAVIFTDQGITASGLLGMMTNLTANSGIEYHLFDRVPAEPSYTAVDEMAAFVRTCGADAIIALGGGSVMDSAKLCSLLYGNVLSVRNLLASPQTGRKGLRTIMLPTTCGTGAEATCNAIVSVPEEDMKVGIVNDAMIPDLVLLDPEFIRKLPRPLVAATGVDALTHVVECFTSRKANPISDVYAGMGAKLIFNSIRAAYEHPEDMAAKENMMLGAHLGGLAITSSGTTAVHALSYPLGGKYHIPHGVSNAILFVPVMKVNRAACRDRLAELSDIAWPQLSGRTPDWKSQHIIAEIAEIVAFTQIPDNLSAFHVPKEDLDWLTDAGSKVTRLLCNNRKELTKCDIRGIYDAILS